MPAVRLADGAAQTATDSRPEPESPDSSTIDTTRPADQDPSAGPRREVGLDAVRLLGVVAIVAGHTWPTQWVGDVVFPWHVPLFFVLTGYLWRDRSWAQELTVRTQSLLRPYLFWLVVMGAVMVVVRGGRDGYDTALRELLPALAWGGQALVQPFSAYWFITCLFCSCLLYAAADRSGPVARWSLFVTGAALTVYGSEQLAGLPLSAGTAVPAVVFIEAGRQLHRRERWLQGRATVMAAVLVVVLAAIAVAAGRLPRVDLKAGDFGVPVLSAMLGVALSVALLVLARAVCRPLGERAGRAVTTMATAVVPVVLLHPLALEVPAGGGWRPAYFAAGLLIPLGLAQAVARTRLSGWMLGHRHHTGPGSAASRHADLSSRPTC